jgi:hypothetical protein
MTGCRLGIQIEMRAFCKKNWIYDCRMNRGTIDVEMSHNMRICMMHSFEWDMLESIPEYNADLSLSQNKISFFFPIKATTTCWPMVPQQHFNLIPF